MFVTSPTTPLPLREIGRTSEKTQMFSHLAMGWWWLWESELSLPEQILFLCLLFRGALNYKAWDFLLLYKADARERRNPLGGELSGRQWDALPCLRLEEGGFYLSIPNFLAWAQSTMVGIGSETELLWLQSWLHLWLIRGPWKNCLTSPCLSFFTCKRESNYTFLIVLLWIFC
jgi:hypothetical protein